MTEGLDLIKQARQVMLLGFLACIGVAGLGLYQILYPTVFTDAVYLLPAGLIGALICYLCWAMVANAAGNYNAEHKSLSMLAEEVWTAEVNQIMAKEQCTQEEAERILAERLEKEKKK